MKKLILISLVLTPILCRSQSLGSERIERLNKSVVRIIIDSIPAGTGFFVRDDGWVVTCHHVVQSAFIRDPVTNRIIRMRKIFIEFQNGEKVQMGLMTHLLNDGYQNAFTYDYSLLKVQSAPKTAYKTLKIGKWSDINDGDMIYSCGYPLGIAQRFISQGLFSTKWIDSLTLYKDKTPIGRISRNVAWLDLTMNKGNSGGPIIKIGNTPEEDRVIGIATFILNPYAKSSEYMAGYLPNRGIDMQSEGISQNQLMQILFEAISNNSIGVSGCLSINYVSEIINAIR